MKFEGLVCAEISPMPAVIVIFGATGDLARRKLFPALRNLHDRNLLNEESLIIACGRKDFTDDSFRQLIGGKDDFLKHIVYCKGDIFGDDIYINLQNLIAGAEKRSPDLSFNILYYLALSTDDMLKVCYKLSANSMLEEGDNEDSWKHVVFEKPFGHDLQSARSLNKALERILDEKQIYRIDHYLGKETVQNILMLRFANTIFEPLWRAEYISSVEITAAESIGIEHRGPYYDKSGALRDMFQNHMLQLLSLTAMEAPGSFQADAVRAEKTKLLRSIRPFDTDDLANSIVRGQYCAAGNMNSYTQEDGVASDSATETYVAAKIFIDNWRWRGVPFYLRSGKRLSNKKSEIAISIKNIPHSIFPHVSPEMLGGNSLILHIYPTEGITLSLQAKQPGPKLCIGEVQLKFDYGMLGKSAVDDAYERLLLDALLGDQTLFIDSAFIDEAWKLFTPVLGKWQGSDEKPEPYLCGSDGPLGAKKLIAPGLWRSLDLD